MSIFEKFTKGVSEAGNKAKITLEATKLKSQITKNTEEIGRIYAIIGEKVFEHHNAGNLQINTDITSYIEQITQLQEKNSEIDKEIKTLWNVKDCICGNSVAIDVKFCPSCGYNFPLEAEQVKAEPVVVNDATVLLGGTPPVATVQEELPKVICPNCDADLEHDARFCGECGTQI